MRIVRTYDLERVGYQLADETGRLIDGTVYATRSDAMAVLDRRLATSTGCTNPVIVDRNSAFTVEVQWVNGRRVTT